MPDRIPPAIPLAILWDFDGTLAHRPGLWAGTLLDCLPPGHELTRDDLRPHLRSGFPWHQPGRPHPELSDPDAWWAAMAERLARALTAAGVPDGTALEAAARARREYLRPQAWVVPPQARAALALVAAAGARNVILSNHVPELPDLVQALGLGEPVHAVLSSAVIGFEKPHPEAFRAALRAAGPTRQVRMVGDDPVADVAGAEALGIPALLVGPGFGPLEAARQLIGG